ncbi:efflux RND transporter periplasmic adaptor subunit [Pseudoalteromonas peptidolytica]|uniref:efflux RND transporter periplasmic adaptor subunit n=1 Tax=Pseudoalteromonas peptidolytica TaxID=61150 RepID=UPI00298EA100|nr:efflux RND transporter periplasmic adaptor subunit [Pseudoalteromonas peptidolytica]MDW7550402.1 efflux RND transporter periplasmic adaptor subunit [Pseudoalteromonas peptidolytica]
MKLNSLLIIIITTLLSACDQPQTPVELPLRSVKTVTVNEANTSTTRSISGALASPSVSQLSFRVSGLVDTLAFQEGDTIRAGETVSRLVQRDYQLQLNSAQAQLNSARSALNEKEEELSRQKQLKSKGFVAQAAVDKAQAEYNLAMNNLEIANTDLESAKNNLSYTTLSSPISGKVARRLVEPFAEVTAGQAIYEIQSGTELEVNVLVPETMISDVNYGDIVKVVIPSIKDTQFSATISQIGTQTLAGNAYEVSAKLSVVNDQMKAGMTAKVSFNQVTASDKVQFLIPLTALDTRLNEQPMQLESNQVPVFVVEEGVAVRKVITVDEFNSNSLQVIDGLNVGDRVIVAGVSFIEDGQRVTLWKPDYNLPAIINQ